ncbi:MAG: hypothetical protein WBB45_00070 [Cyclobacteriaceae bacterium]
MDDIGIFVYIGFMILYGIMKAMKKKKARPVTNQPKADTDSKGLDLEEILGDMFGESKHREEPADTEVAEAEVKEKLPRQRRHRDDLSRRDKPRRLFELEDENKVKKTAEELEEENRVEKAEVTNRYQSINELGTEKAARLDDTVSLDTRTRSKLEVVDLDEEEAIGSHADILEAVHNKDEFKKAFILSEIIQRKYE